MSGPNSTTTNSNKYSVSPSISAVVRVFGEHANNYKIFRTETKQPAQTLLSYLSADFSRCYLHVSMTDPHAVSQIPAKRTLHIPVDGKQDFWLGFGKLPDLENPGFEIKLPMATLGHNFITMLENLRDTSKLDEYFMALDTERPIITLDVQIEELPEIYKPYNIRVAEFHENLSNIPESQQQPHTLLPTTYTTLPEECRAAIKYQLVIVLQKQNLKHQIKQIASQSAHNLYPAMNEKYKRRARLLDCLCLKFGCNFVCATPDELKEHLKLCEDSDYVDFYAANHYRLATDSMQIIDDQLFKNSFPALCRKTARIVQGSKGEEKRSTYSCNSLLCEYSTSRLENMLEHFRLLGCAYTPIIKKYYGSDHPLPTEEDNRKWQVASLVDNGIPDDMPTSAIKVNLEKNPDIYRFDIQQLDRDWQTNLAANLALGDNCINCNSNRQNVVSLGCCHLSVCSKCLGGFKDPKCAECFEPITEYMIITGI
jgi:hypothetical protein